MRGASWWAIAVGLPIAAMGFLAATAAGMATAPRPGSGLLPMAMIATGAAMIVLGFVPLARPQLRPLAGRLAVGAAVGLALIYFVYQILMRTGFIDG